MDESEADDESEEDEKLGLPKKQKDSSMPRILDVDGDGYPILPDWPKRGWKAHHAAEIYRSYVTATYSMCFSSGECINSLISFIRDGRL